MLVRVSLSVVMYVVTSVWLRCFVYVESQRGRKVSRVFARVFCSCVHLFCYISFVCVCREGNSHGLYTLIVCCIKYLNLNSLPWRSGPLQWHPQVLSSFHHQQRDAYSTTFFTHRPPPSSLTINDFSISMPSPTDIHTNHCPQTTQSKSPYCLRI